MRAACACLAVVLLGSASPSRAASPDARQNGKPASAATAADREVARALAKRGYELFEQGDYKNAIVCFRGAEEHFHAPPHWLYIARASVKLGKLVEGKDAYEQIVAEKIGADAPQPFRDAQSSARTELAELESKIPSLEITLTGPAAAKATVTVDGMVVAPEDLGRPKPWDPGLHTIVVEAPGVPKVERQARLEEGSKVERVTIAVDASSPSIAPPVVAFTLGGLSLAAGGVTLGLALTNHGTTTQDLKLVKNLEIASVATFVGGAIGVGVGITLVALRPSRKAAPSAALGPRVEAKLGPSSIAVQGRF